MTTTRKKPSPEYLAKKSQVLESFKVSKDFSELPETIQLHATATLQFAGEISLRSYAHVLWQLQVLGLEGQPYIDVRTYDHWIEVGRRVRKGEKSQIFSITWKGGTPKEGDESNPRLYPKVTNLFHVSQTDLIES
jgi:hypothetical protein